MQPELRTIRLSEIVFDPVIYPRRDHDPALVQTYAEDFDQIEAAKRHIAVGADLKLLDGKHRWLAARKRCDGGDREIQVLVYPVTAPQDPTDLANMPLEKFTRTLAEIINGFARKLSSGAAIALMISPTQWNADGRKFTDHLLDVARLVKLPVDMRIQAPYECSQCEAQQDLWAKEHRTCLVLSCEIVVWRIE